MIDAEQPAPPGAGGWSGRLRRLLGTGVALLQVRLDLLAIELEEEKRRLFDALLWAVVALLLIGIGLLLLVGWLVWITPAAWRPWVLGGAALVSLAGGMALLRGARQRVASDDGPAPATRAELREDRAALTGRSGP
jgi:uncharacterized membrane protein YqjE